MKTLRIQPVILAGGSGTRLWPISRGDYPKQLLQLDDELTMLQRTAVRLEGANSAEAEAARKELDAEAWCQPTSRSRRTTNFCTMACYPEEMAQYAF